MPWQSPSTLSIILTFVLGAIFGFGIITIFKFFQNRKIKKLSVDIIENARNEADKFKRDKILELKEESFKLKQTYDNEVKKQKDELKETESRLLQRENSLDKRDEIIQKREQVLDERDASILEKMDKIQEKEVKVDEILKNELDQLEKIGKMSKDKARDAIMKRVEKDMENEIIEYIKEKEQEAKRIGHDRAKNIIVESMQRYSEDVASEQTVSAITLPNDEMKGRLIGREGRNIRTIESVTGVDLIIDDTPETIVISSFDPFRREIAKITIETLIKDGRIHPSRIEEVYDKVCNDMQAKTIELGNEALYKLGIHRMDPELVLLIGKLNYRTSYGQNALKHSVEVAILAGLMASEIDENVIMAKRAGLLHDIGKAIDFEMEGSHVEIGVDIAKKYKEDEVVINAIASHHNDAPQEHIISVLVQVADTLSAARPGARNDSLDNYIKRLEQLEEIGNSFEGVEKTYAMQAGREVRVIVKPDEINDLQSSKIAREMKSRIESEMQYPGTVKVIVIRELRAQEEAK